MRAALYARVSTERQADRGTIGSQLAVLRERVAADGDELVAEFGDDGHSGARLDRPGLDALRDAAEAGLIERCGACRRTGSPASTPTRSSCSTSWPATGSRCASPTPQPSTTTRRPAAHPGAGRDRRVRAGQDRRTLPARQAVPLPRRGGARLEDPYGYRRIPRSPATGPARLEVFEPEAAVVRRIFDDRAAGITMREISRRLNADAMPSPTGKPTWGHSTLSRLLRNEAYIGRVYFNRTESVPDRRPTRRTRQVPRDREEWIPIDCPRIIADELFEAAGRVAATTPSGAHAAPNPATGCCEAWSNAVSAASAPTATRCAAATAPGTATTTAATTTRSAPAANHRCPERNIRADALDTFVFDQIRAASPTPTCCSPANKRSPLRTPTPDDELLAAELARLDRKLDATDAERRRLVDLYQAGLIDLPEMQRRATEVTARRNELQHTRQPHRTNAALARDNQLRRRVHDFAARVLAVIDNLDFDQKQQLLRLVVEEVRVTGWHVQIRLRIALGPPPPQPPQPTGPPCPTGPTGKPSLHPRPVSTQDGLRSLSEHHWAVVALPDAVRQVRGGDRVRVRVRGAGLHGLLD